MHSSSRTYTEPNDVRLPPVEPPTVSTLPTNDSFNVAIFNDITSSSQQPFDSLTAATVVYDKLLSKRLRPSSSASKKSRSHVHKLEIFGEVVTIGAFIDEMKQIVQNKLSNLKIEKAQVNEKNAKSRKKQQIKKKQSKKYLILAK